MASSTSISSCVPGVLPGDSVSNCGAGGVGLGLVPPTIPVFDLSAVLSGITDIEQFKVAVAAAQEQHTRACSSYDLAYSRYLGIGSATVSAAGSTDVSSGTHSSYGSQYDVASTARSKGWREGTSFGAFQYSARGAVTTGVPLSRLEHPLGKCYLAFVTGGHRRSIQQLLGRWPKLVDILRVPAVKFDAVIMTQLSLELHDNMVCHVVMYSGLSIMAVFAGFITRYSGSLDVRSSCWDGTLLHAILSRGDYGELAAAVSGKYLPKNTRIGGAGYAPDATGGGVTTTGGGIGSSSWRPVNAPIGATGHDVEPIFGSAVADERVSSSADGRGRVDSQVAADTDLSFVVRESTHVLKVGGVPATGFSAVCRDMFKFSLGDDFCYRRNYFSVDVSLPRQLLDSEAFSVTDGVVTYGCEQLVFRLKGVRVVAGSSSEALTKLSSPVECVDVPLTLFDTKRNPVSSGELCFSYSSEVVPVTFVQAGSLYNIKRLQFRYATIDLSSFQREYVSVVVQVCGRVSVGGVTKDVLVSEVTSSPFTVRGRSPRHFERRTSRVSAGRRVVVKGKASNASLRSMSSDVSTSSSESSVGSSSSVWDAEVDNVVSLERYGLVPSVPLVTGGRLGLAFPQYARVSQFRHVWE